jgi:PTS system nitrogen regulatory IIA component
MKIGEFIQRKAITNQLVSKNKLEVVAELATLLCNAHEIENVDTVISPIHERERLYTTDIGEGISIPHGTTDKVNRTYGAIGISKSGLYISSTDRKPVHIVFILIEPPEHCEQHLEVLSSFCRLFSHNSIFQALLSAESIPDIIDLISNKENGFLYPNQ